MSVELNTELRLTANNSDLLAKNAQAKASIADIGVEGQKAGAAASAGFERASASAGNLASSAVNARNIVSTLGPAVSTASSQVVTSSAQAAASIDSIAASAETTAARVVASNDAMAASYAAFQAEMRVVQEFMATEAKSLDDVIERRIAYNDALKVGALTQEEYGAATAALAKQEAAILASSNQRLASIESLVQKYASSSSAAQKLAADEAVLNNALKSGAGDAQAITSALAAIAEKRAALSEEAPVVNGLTGSMGKLQFQTAGVTQEVTRLGSEAIRGNFARMETSAVVLAQRAGLLGLAFSGVGAAILGTVAVLGTAIALFVGAQNETDAYNRALILTGNYANSTSQDLSELSTKVGEQTGHYSDAQKALTQLAGSGKIAGDQLEGAARGAVEFGELTDQAIDKSVDVFEKLAADPVKTLTELNDRMHFLSAAQLEEVASLQEVGDKTDAARIATQLFIGVVDDRIGAYKGTLGVIQKAWDSITTSIGGAIDSAKNFFAIGPSKNSFTGFFANLFSGADPAAAAFTARNQNTGIADAAAKNAAAIRAESQAEQDFANQFVVSNQKELDALDKESETFDKGKLGLAKYETEKELLAAAARFHGQALIDETNLILDQRQPVEDAAAGVDKLTEGKKSAAEAARQWAEDERTLTEVINQANGQVEKGIDLAGQLAAETNGPLFAAQKKYDDEINVFANAYAGLTAQFNLGLISEQQYDDGVAKVIDGTVRATSALNSETQSIRARLDVGATLIQRLKDENEALSQGTNAEKAWQLVEKASEEAFQHRTDLSGKVIDDENERTKAINAGKAALANHVQALLDDNDALKQNEAINKEWVGIASNGLDSFGSSIASFVTGGIKSWHDFWKSLLSDTQQFIAAIIQEMLKLTVFNGIINNLFGLTGSNALPTGLGNGLIGQLFGTATGGGLGNLLGGGVGQAFGGVGNWLGGAATWLLGSSGGALAGAGASGAVTAAGGNLFAGGVLDGVGATGGYTAAGSGAIGGGSTGVLGTQGIGDAFGKFAPVFGGALAGYQLGGAGGALALGALSYAVPVVGWALGIASLVNSITGGGLFGTSYKPTGQTSLDFTVGAGGSNVQDFYQESKKKAFFGGTKYKNVSVAPTQDQLDAASQFDASLQQLRTSAADSLGTTVADIVTGAFKQVTDKSGKITSQVSTILGRTFSESLQDFQTRELAVNLIAQVNKALGTEEATQLASKFVSNAQQYYDAAQLLLAAQVDVQHGMSLLGDDTSLTDIFNVVTKLQGANETLVQTYARLQTETQTVTSIWDDLGWTLNKTGSDVVEFSDKLVQAAGGIDNLNQLAGDFFNNYYSDSERAAAKLKSDQATAQKLGAAIGQDPNESMAQFRQNFEAVQASLSPDDIVKWLQFAEALAAVNQDLGTTTAQAQQTAQAQAQAKASYDAFITTFKLILNPLTDFESALQGVNAQLAANIAQANAYAIAAGQSGASTQALTTILQASVQQGVQAYQQLQAKTAQDAATLFGSNIDQLQKQLADAEAGGAQNVQRIIELQGKIAQAQAAQDAATKLSQATTVLQDFGQLGAFDGKTLAELAKQYGVPLDQLAQYLGTDSTGLQQQFEQSVQIARSALDTANNTKYTNELLADILAEAQGLVQPFSVADLISALNPTASQQATPGAKPATVSAKGPVLATAQPAPTTVSAPPPSTGDGSSGSGGDDAGKQIGRVADAVDGNTRALVTDVQSLGGKLDDLSAALRQFMQEAARKRLAQTASTP